MKRYALTITVLTIALVFYLVTASLCADDGWVPLFYGKTLDGWEVNGGTAAYKVEDGVIVGTTVEGSPNTFLCKGIYKDFVLELEVKCDPRLNSGVQVRSHVYEKDDANPENRKRAGVVYGPQCEIARKVTGTAGRFYDEGRRGKWLADIRPEAEDAFRDDDWNHYRIIVNGNRYRSWVNGIAASDFTDHVDKGGFIGLQVHAIAKDQGPYQVRWRDIRIKELKPGEEASSPEPPDGFKAVFNGHDYYYGDGLGVNCSLDVKPDGRFSFMWRGCLGVYGKNEGGAKLVNNHLLLTPEQPNDSGGFGGTPTDFVAVRWGNRFYLIPDESGKAFCDEVNRGWEPRSNAHGRFYLRRGDWQKKVSGLPIVPKKWEAWLQKQSAGAQQGATTQ